VIVIHNALILSTELGEAAMQAVVTAWGSAEDFTPFITLAKGLRAYGVDCHFALPSNLVQLPARAGFPVTQVGPDELGRLYEEAEPDLQEGRLQSEALDRYGEALMSAGPDAFTSLATLCAGADCLVGSITMPLGRIVHELTHTRYVAIQIHNPCELLETPPELVEFRAQLGLDRASEPGPRGISPMYGFSPELTLVATSPLVLGVMFDGDLYWPAHCHAVGFLFDADGGAFQPHGELERFMASGPPPVVFSLGTRRRYDRPRIMSLYAEAARLAGRRAILRDPWTDGVDWERPEHALVVGAEVPAAWLLERAACVVHDTDSGATAVGLRSGAPTVPIPSDPSLLGWARASQALGCSPAVLPFAELTAPSLAGALAMAVDDPRCRACAGDVRRAILAEHGTDTATRLIRDFLASRTPT
jgi:UDP:flavonoid glycosyltransferase YjiC (YdhE family)